MSRDYYVLNDKYEAVPCSGPGWMRWLIGNRKKVQVEFTEVDGGAIVSTVFLGIDRNHFGVGKPILWETMVFGGGYYSGYMERYTSHQDALDGHQRIVRKIRERSGQ